MRIRIKDLGPISNFEFDLSKDLNIIFGKNNIGKSYAITVVYLILKNLVGQSNRYRPFEVDLFVYRNFRDEKANTITNKLITDAEKKIIDAFKNKATDELEITNSVEKIFKELINQSFLKDLENSFKNSFSSIEELSNKFSKNTLSIELVYDDLDILIESKENSLIVKDIKFKRNILVKRAASNRKPLLSKEKFIFYHNTKSGSIDIMENCVIRLYSNFRRETSSLINNVYFLPASRSGLYQALSTFSAVIAELSKSRTFLTNRIELPNISEPVSDYFLKLSNIGSRTRNDYKDIVEKIEKNILKGKILFNKDIKKIVFSQDEIRAELDLAFTSSMISEIAPIVAYLKYIIQLEEEEDYEPFRIRFYGDRSSKGYNLLFIEEPEAHLHPEVQVQLMEIFSNLIERKVKIIMTTHSNYMFNKLSNLILEDYVDYKRVGSYLMTTTEMGSVIDTIKMKAEEEGITDENFADIAEKLYEERISIYDKLNSSKR